MKCIVLSRKLARVLSSLLPSLSPPLLLLANIWYCEKMPYCELEPLGVAWWERRKGLATAILYEAANRVKKLFPQCKGMTGGDQIFYEKIGFVEKARCEQYKWQTEIYPSWDKRSEEMKPQI